MIIEMSYKMKTELGCFDSDDLFMIRERMIKYGLKPDHHNVGSLVEKLEMEFNEAKKLLDGIGKFLGNHGGINHSQFLGCFIEAIGKDITRIMLDGVSVRNEKEDGE